MPKDKKIEEAEAAFDAALKDATETSKDTTTWTEAGRDREGFDAKVAAEAAAAQAKAAGAAPGSADGQPAGANDRVIDMRAASEGEQKAQREFRDILENDGRLLQEELETAELSMEAITLGDLLAKLQANATTPLTDLDTLAASLTEEGNPQFAEKAMQLKTKLLQASETLASATALMEAAIVAKKQKDKKNEVDPNECKLWISWDSMYRRVKMGKWIGMTVSSDWTAKVWDLSKYECRGTLAGQHEAPVKCGIMDPETKVAITGAMDGTLIKWSIESMEAEESFLSGKYGAWFSIDADFKRKRAITGSADGTVCIWDAQKFFVKEQFAAHEGSKVTICKADFKNNRALTGSDADGRLRIWDLETLSCLGTFDSKADGTTRVAEVDWKNKRVLSGSAMGSLYFWDMDTCKMLNKLQGHTDKVTNLTVDPKFQYAISTSDDETARIWNLGQRSGAMGVLTGHVQSVRDARADWKQNMIVTCSDDSTVRVWDMTSYACTNILEGHMDRVTALRARFDRGMVLSASDDYTMRLWDLEMMQEEFAFYGHAGPIKTVVAQDRQA